jgi:hypothetical protein
MNLWQQYLRPTSVTEAVTALTSAPGLALPLAGGTDILLDLNQGRHSPVHTIVDLTEIPEMKCFELRDGRLYIGAGVPVSRIARDPLAVTHAQALIEACDLIGGPQVRNVATLGGNVAHALPAADGTIGLMCLDAEAEVAGPWGIAVCPCMNCSSAPANRHCRRARSSSAFTWIKIQPTPGFCLQTHYAPARGSVADHQQLRLAGAGWRHDQEHPHCGWTGRRSPVPCPQSGSVPGWQALHR